MKTTINFGKIAYMNSSKNCPVDVTIELRKQGGEDIFTIDNKTKEHIYTGEKTPVYYELSICGNIWNHLRTDIYRGGQCLDTIAEYIKTKEFNEIYTLWKKYHLNGMRAGTPLQESAIKGWLASGKKYDYTEVCEMLKSIDLYEVEYTGLTVGKKYDHELYKYGHGWVIEELPQNVIDRVTEIIEENNK